MRRNARSLNGLRYRVDVVEPSDTAASASLPMPALQATAVVGVGSVITLGLSVLSMKIYALLVGTQGVGLLALMQSVINLLVIIAGMGLATSVIGRLSAAIQAGDSAQEVAIERAALRLVTASALVVAVVLVLGREPLAQVALGSRAHSRDLPFLAAATGLTVVAITLTGILVGRQRVGAVTALGVGTGFAALCLGVPLVWAFGNSGLALALLATAAAQLALAWLTHFRLGRPQGATSDSLKGEARSLLRLGVPVATSQLASTGAAFLVPLIVLQSTGQSEVGLYRAAAAISVGYLTFFLSALTQDYLPRISSVQDPDDLAVLIERRMRLVLGIGAPLIIGLLAVGPWLLQVLYSADFSRAFGVLQWQLVGDLLRLPAWVLTFILLARRSGASYLAIEVAGGASLLLLTVGGLSVAGLSGAGMGYAASQALYYLMVWVVVRRQVPTAPGRLQLMVVALAVGCVALLMLAVPDVSRLHILGVTAIALASLAWPRLYRLHGAGEL